MRWLEFGPYLFWDNNKNARFRGGFAFYAGLAGHAVRGEVPILPLLRVALPGQRSAEESTGFWRLFYILRIVY